MAVAGLDAALLAELVAEAKQLATRYYRATGKPLGVTGEVAEMEAARLLGLELAPPRTAGYDALDRSVSPPRRIQIKGRAVDPGRRYAGRCPAIKCGGMFDTVLLVLMDKATLEPLEIWESDEARVTARLAAPGSRSRNERNSMGLSQFKSIARLAWRK